MSTFKPRLTTEQYREVARTFQVGVAEAAWSLVVSPADAGQPRRWRSLTAEESEELFDRLMSAITRFALVDRAVIGPRP